MDTIYHMICLSNNIYHIIYHPAKNVKVADATLKGGWAGRQSVTGSQNFSQLDEGLFTI